MTGRSDGLARILARVECVLFDFDGPVCAIFAGVSAPAVAAHLADVIRSWNVEVPDYVGQAADPFDVWKFAATLGPELASRAEAALRDAERDATKTARPTPYAADAIKACRSTGRTVAIVSNNSATAVESYLRAHDLDRSIDLVIARTEPDPALLKPSPHLVTRAVDRLSAKPDACALIGDSTTDITGARAAGTHAIGYANKTGKRDRLTAAGADAIIDSMAEIPAALLDTE